MQLTIAIPTYNRNEILRENLAHLLPQLTAACRLLILDNASPTPVAATLQELLAGYPEAVVTIVRHPVNIGGCANVMRCFELCETDWLWILGDDDQVRPDAVATILRYLRSYPDCLFLNFASLSVPRAAETLTTGRAELLRANPRFGSLIYLSCSVYRATSLRANVRFGYQCTYSMAPHFATLLVSLGDTGSCCLAAACLLQREHMAAAGQRWSPIDGGLGVAMLLDLPLPQRERQALAQKLAWYPAHVIVHDLLLQGEDESIGYLYEQICSRLYRYNLSPLSRVQARVLGLLLVWPRCSRWLLRILYRRLKGQEKQCPARLCRF